MSKIYDALVLAAKNSRSRTAALRTSTGQKARFLNLSSLKIGLEWKIAGVAATGLLVFGGFLIIVANQLITGALRDEIDQRALAITNNLSSAAAGPVIRTNILELYALLTKYAQLRGVAYAFIEDTNGKIIANSMKPFPTELVGTSTPDERKRSDTRAVTVEGKTVYETRVPILEGQLGAAHVGIWAENVEKEINAARLSFFAVVVLALFVAVGLCVFLVRAAVVRIGEETGLASDVGASELKPAVENRIAR